MESIWEQVAGAWGEFVPRSQVPKFTGGAYSKSYMAKLDHLGKGPKERFRLGRQVIYPTHSLVEWLESRTTKLR